MTEYQPKMNFRFGFENKLQIKSFARKIHLHSLCGTLFVSSKAKQPIQVLHKMIVFYLTLLSLFWFLYEYGTMEQWSIHLPALKWVCECFIKRWFFMWISLNKHKYKNKNKKQRKMKNYFINNQQHNSFLDYKKFHLSTLLWVMSLSQFNYVSSFLLILFVILYDGCNMHIIRIHSVSSFEWKKIDFLLFAGEPALCCDNHRKNKIISHFSCIKIFLFCYLLTSFHLMLSRSPFPPLHFLGTFISISLMYTYNMYVCQRL